MGGFKQDLRYSVRMLTRKPAVSLMAVAMLAMGIGANTAIYSAIDAFLLRDLPFPDPERLVMIWENDTREGNRRNPVAPANFVDWRRLQRVCAGLAYFTQRTGLNLTGGDAPERVNGVFVSQNLFALLGSRPILGRDFIAEDVKERGGLVVVLSHGLWQRRFGSDSSVIGKALTLDGLAYVVIGVMPPHFQLPEAADLWGLTLNGERATMRGQYFLRVMGRLKQGVTLQEARAQLSLIASQLEQQHPDTNAGRGVTVLTLREQLVGNIQTALWVMFGAVAFMLAIACANVANLLLVRAAGRRREIAIRMASGATRARLIRQLFTESLLLAGTGGALGWLLASWSVGAIESIGADAAWSPEVGVSHRVAWFTALVTGLTSVLFGLAPAFAASAVDVNDALRETASSAVDSSNRVRSVLVISEVALALTLLTGAGLTLRSFVRLQEVDIGFDASAIVTMQLEPSGGRYDNGDRLAVFYQELVERLAEAPEIVSAAAISRLPLAGDRSTSTVRIEGRVETPGEQNEVHFRRVTPDYFRTLRIPLREGRALTTRDHAAAPPVAAVNETFAHRYWPGQNAIGKRVRLGGNPNSAWIQIVGVVADVRNFGLENEAMPELYVAHLQSPEARMRLLVRTTADPRSAVAVITSVIRSLDKDLPLGQVATMEQLLAQSVADRRRTLTLLGLFAALALVMAAAGIYAVMSYVVTVRTRELGVRLALGARAKDVMKLVLGQSLRLLIPGAAIGLISSLVLTQLMTKLLYEVSPFDPLTFVAAATGIVVVGLVACLLPARRATNADPLVALRCE